jgi:hypothetical protein
MFKKKKKTEIDRKKKPYLVWHDSRSGVREGGDCLTGSGVGLWRFGEPVWCVSYDSRSGVTVWERDVADWGLKMKMVAGGRGMWLTGVWRWRWWERDVAGWLLKMKMLGEGCGWLWSSRWRWIDFVTDVKLWVEGAAQEQGEGRLEQEYRC